MQEEQKEQPSGEMRLLMPARWLASRTTCQVAFEVIGPQAATVQVRR